MLIDTNDTSAATDASEVPDTTPTDAPTSAPTTSASRVPDETQRPAFVVFDDAHEEAGYRYAPGVWHFGLKAGKGNTPPMLTQAWVCSPLHVDAVTTDATDGSYGRLLRFKSARGKWKTWAMPMEMLAGDGTDLRARLLNQGVHIDLHARNQLPVYLQRTTPKRHLQCVLHTGWSDTSRRAFVLPDAVVGPKAAGVVYQSEERDNGEYRTGGTLQGWQTGVAAVAVGNPMLVLALCTAFAGPLLALCHAESGGPHYVGGSSTGKTSLLEAACSTWGPPDAYKRSWRATSNGLEAAAAMFNDSMLALDEISECDPKAVGEVVYMLGNGRGKARASRAGGARHVARWRCSLISTGERGIGTSMAEGGYRIKAGQEVRVFDVPCERTYGAWDNLHHHASGVAFSNALKREAATHHGHAGRAFLEHLSRDDTDMGEALHVVRNCPEFHTDGEGQEQRVAGRFALLALAGEVASRYGVTGWQPGEAIRAAGVAFAAWRNQRSASNGANAEHGQVVEAVTAFIERHGDSRFSNADAHDEQRAALIRDRAGYWRDTNGQRAYLFNAAGMREALKGFDFERAMTMLEHAGLTPPPGKDGKRSRGIKVAGKLFRAYAVWPDGVPQQGQPPV